MTNIYRHKFYARCPNNKQLIEYLFELRANRVILVEDIVDYCAGRREGYHENIADMLSVQFGGQQQLIAFHHGVEITTLRGALNAPDFGRLTQRIQVGSTVYEKGVEAIHAIVAAAL